MKILQIIVIVLISTLSNAQVNISNTGAYGNPSYLVNNVLAGTGVTASNITFTGNNAQIGFFDSGLNGLPNLGLDSGIVISSGDVLDIAPGGNQPDQGQYNAPGDTNLLSVAKSVTSNPNAGFITDTYDAAALEFDFIPVGDTVRFEFVFASEEYTTYINTQFNDVFAFFLSGPGITGPYESPTSFPGGAKNVALVPGTSSPITISTIYNDPAQTPTQSNGQYYVSNFFEQNNDFNGFTTVLVAQSAVQCGQLYHFKFAIADCGDDYLDTGVFLKANSLTSSGIRISVTTPFPDSTIVEGCGDAIVKFERSDTINNDTLHLNFSGTANSSDYDGLPNPIIFPKDSTSIAYALSAELDDESESTETLQIEITGIMGCNGTSLKIENYEEMSVIVSDSINICSQAGEKGTVSFSLDGGKEPFNYEWEDIVNGGFFTADNESFAVSPEKTTLFLPTITDACLNEIQGEPVPVWVQCPVEPINVFTPNGDGLNDYFTFKYFDQYEQIKIDIFDRWGKLVYTSEKYQNDWDASGVSDGVYYYTVEVISEKYIYDNNSNKEELGHTLNGYFMVLR